MKSVPLLFLAWTLFSCALSPAGQLARANYPGKGIDGACATYAKALNTKLKASGVSSRVIRYFYSPHPGTFASHAIVLYTDSNRTMAMDNEIWQPIWLASATNDLDRVRDFVNQRGGNSNTVTFTY